MKKVVVAVLATACLMLGVGIGYAAKSKGPGMTLIAGKPAKEAALAALQEAERRAGDGSWELIGVGRVYYLSGDKARGQALLDKVINGDAGASDWHRIGQLYAEAGENAKAEAFFQKALAAEPEDDRGQAEVGAWYIRTGQREKGEELLTRAFAENPDEMWHYVRTAEAFLNIAPN
ncbi:MAG: tetratricopeptide repeat protein [Steroidobacter sp.]